jgi:hypothetical protein
LGQLGRAIFGDMTPGNRREPCQIIDFNAARLRRLKSRTEIDLLELIGTARRSPNRLVGWTLPKGTALVFDNPSDTNEPSSRFVATAPLPLAPILTALNGQNRHPDADSIANVLCALGIWLEQDVIAAVI